MNWFISRRKFLAHLASSATLLGLKNVKLWAASRSTSPTDAEAKKLSIWFNEPAKQWADALPVGNGRLGAMVFGGYSDERLALNEDTLWSGFPRDWNNPAAKEHLPIVRKDVLQDQNYHAADQECRKMQGPYNQSYEPLGDLLLKFAHRDAVTGYRRSLDLDSGVATVTYQIDDCQFNREILCSAPAQLLVIRLSASQPARIDCEIRLTSKLRATSQSTDSGEIVLSGKAPSESIPAYLRDEKNPIRFDDAPGKGMHFASVLRVRLNGGVVSNLSDGALRIQGASAVELYIGAATGYRGYAVGPDTPVADVIANAKKHLAPAMALPYEKLRAAIISSFSAEFPFPSTCRSPLRTLPPTSALITSPPLPIHRC
jgi:alpha-L-fucosidase 2